MTRISPLALLLSAVLAVPAQAASGEPASLANAAPVEDLTELEEVRVRGKLVANAVITAENRVFRLYNKLNKNNRFDVHCMDVRPFLDWDTLAMQHTCLPEFLGYYSTGPYRSGYGSSYGSGNWYAPPAPFSHYSEPPLVCGTDTCYSPGSWSSPAFAYRAVPMGSFTALPAPAPAPAAPAVTVPAAERAAYSENVLRVIRSDPQLLDMATELAGMYEEMERVQNHFLKLSEERKAARAAKKAAARERAKERERERGYKLRPTYPRAT